jgi:hypothetical protein
MARQETQGKRRKARDARQETQGTASRDGIKARHQGKASRQGRKGRHQGKASRQGRTQDGRSSKVAQYSHTVFERVLRYAVV